MAESTNGNGNGWRSTYWMAIAAILSGLSYAWYLASEQGTLQNEVTDLGRRISIIEQYGSPALSGIKTEAEINNRRLTLVETAVGDKIPTLQTHDATMEQQIMQLAVEVTNFRRWQEAHAHENQDISLRVGKLEGDRRLETDLPHHGQ